MSGTVRRNAASNTPWCVWPSSPTTPALSTARIILRCCKAPSWMSWSYARCKNVEYTAKTGIMPPRARPAQNVTACSSAMPTSKKRLRYFSRKSVRPVPDSIAAVTAHSFSFTPAIVHIISPNACEKPLAMASPAPFSRSNAARPW